MALRLENKKPEDLFLAQAWWSFGLLFRVLVDIFFCLAEARSGNFWVVRFMDPRRAVALRQGTPSRGRGEGEATAVCICTDQKPCLGRFLPCLSLCNEAEWQVVTCSTEVTELLKAFPEEL